MSKEKNKTKKKKAYKLRHKFWYSFLRPVAILFLKIKFGYKFKTAKNLPENYIVLSNHTTDFDPVFVGSSFKKQMYFVASEHITRWNTAYKLLQYVFEPIVRYKGSIASTTVREILRKAKGGQNVCIFAEGVRSWNGETGDILPSTAKLIKSAGCGLVTYKLSGGYFVSPNWSETKTRRGKVTGRPVNVYTKEQIASMTEDELYQIITKDLYENAYAEQLVEKNKYKGKNLAERLENLIFICPECKSYETLKSSGNLVTCSHCNKSLKYNEYGLLEGTEHNTVLALSKWQQIEIGKDVKNNTSYRTPSATISEVSADHSKQQLSAGQVEMNNQVFKCGDIEFDINELVDINIYGKRGIVFSCQNRFYEVVIDRPYNAYKYVLYYKELIKQKTGK